MTIIAHDHAKSVAKAVTWRIIGTADTFVLAVVITGHAGVAGTIIGVGTVTQSILYYAHERLWHLSALNKLFGGHA